MKRRKPAQLTAKSANWLKDRGWVVGNVEKWIPKTRKRKDLFGFIDLIAVRGDDVLGVQVTSSSNAAARMTKAKKQPEYPVWMRAAGFVVHGWKRPCKTRRTWEVREIYPGMPDFTEDQPCEPCIGCGKGTSRICVECLDPVCPRCACKCKESE